MTNKTKIDIDKITDTIKSASYNFSVLFDLGDELEKALYRRGRYDCNTTEKFEEYLYPILGIIYNVAQYFHDIFLVLATDNSLEIFIQLAWKVRKIHTFLLKLYNESIDFNHIPTELCKEYIYNFKSIGEILSTFYLTLEIKKGESNGHTN